MGNVVKKECRMANSKMVRASKCDFWRCIKSFLYSHFLWIGIIIILLGAILACHIYTITEPNNVTLVLSFVGILATFVVISQFSQVQQIKQDFENRINKYDEMALEVKNLQIGLCISHAEIFKKSSPQQSLIYYLRAIFIGLDNALEEKDNLIKCINEIYDLSNTPIKEIGEDVVIKDIITGKKYAFRYDGVNVIDTIYSIKLHKNYKEIEKDFERLIK